MQDDALGPLDAGDKTERWETNDFDHYPVDRRLTGASVAGDCVRVAWDDGSESRFLGWTLIENCPSPERCSPVTKEQLFDVSELQDDFRPTAARVEDGALVVEWSHGEAPSRFHPGWLSAHDPARYDGEDRPARRLWTAADLTEPPTVDGARILEDDAALEAWLEAVAVSGFGRLRGVAIEPGIVERVCARVGTLRDTNFGRVFDVRVKVDADSSAYQPIPLVGHVDLPTREYQPGLQALMCMANTTTGGLATMADGFAIAAALEVADPEAYRLMTTRPIVWANRAKISDYRWRAPAITLGADGAPDTIRIAAFLRGPQAGTPEEQAETLRAYRALARLARDPAFEVAYPYAPGDLVLFDNRRLLHGRTAYDGGRGARWLQGVYLERDELSSRLRMLARGRRTAGAR